MADRLAFVSDEEQERIDRFPPDAREQIVKLMRAMHDCRPDLNQPGMFGDWLDVLERYFADELAAFRQANT